MNDDALNPHRALALAHAIDYHAKMRMAAPPATPADVIATAQQFLGFILDEVK